MGVHLTPVAQGEFSAAWPAVLRALPAKLLLDRVLADLAARSLERTPNTMLFNQTGQPAMSVPLHTGALGACGVIFPDSWPPHHHAVRRLAVLEQARSGRLDGPAPL